MVLLLSGPFVNGKTTSNSVVSTLNFSLSEKFWSCQKNSAVKKLCKVVFSLGCKAQFHVHTLYLYIVCWPASKWFWSAISLCRRTAWVHFRLFFYYAMREFKVKVRYIFNTRIILMLNEICSCLSENCNFLPQLFLNQQPHGGQASHIHIRTLKRSRLNACL